MSYIARLQSAIRLNIRSKLLLVSLALLVIPFIGYKYIQQMEAYLRHEQEKSLLENARVVAAVIQGFPDIFRSHIATPQQAQAPSPKTAAQPPNNEPHLYIRPLKSSIQMDGYADDWIYYRDRTIMYSSVKATTGVDHNQSVQPKQLSYRFQTGHFGRYLFALFQIKDSHIVYRHANDISLTKNDYLQIALTDPKNKLHNYIIATHSPGRVSAYEVSKDKAKTATHLEERIQAVWQETPGGYNIELRIPLSMLGDKLTFAVADVDDAITRNIEFFLTTTESNQLDHISTISIPTPEIDRVLNRILRSSSRIWLLDQYAHVLASAGNLTNPAFESNDVEPLTDISFRQVITGIVRLFYQLLLPQPAREFQDDLSNASVLSGDEVTSALQGRSDTKWRQTPDARVNILTATYPVYDNAKLIGAVAVEETSNSVLILQNKAIEILINVSVLGFIFAMVILLGFASHLSIRIKRLRDNAENAIGEDGRVTGVTMKSASGDEIGDLTRSFANMLDRLANYNRYLETMASKLSHELRTPITVVKSSLENLEHGKLDTQDIAYVERARDGIGRLNGILTRMSEATRLEQTLQQEELSEFNIETVVSSCVKGYQMAKPEHCFEFMGEAASSEDKEILPKESATKEPFTKKSPTEELIVKGVPDLIAQMLDKLVSNAMSFTKPEAPIVVALRRQDNYVVLTVSNEGPLLPEEMQTALFDSMVSVRQKKGAEPHLGLGLYIVRLIAEFHNGQVSARNRTDGKGVEFNVKLPLMS
jgi:dedicated sortase system histidine kinase